AHPTLCAPMRAPMLNFPSFCAGRCSSVGQSKRLISAVSGVQIPAPPPNFLETCGFLRTCVRRVSVRDRGLPFAHGTYFFSPYSSCSSKYPKIKMLTMYLRLKHLWPGSPGRRESPSLDLAKTRGPHPAGGMACRLAHLRLTSNRALGSRSRDSALGKIRIVGGQGAVLHRFANSRRMA